MNEVDILIPKAILDRRSEAIHQSRLDYAALVDALPSTSLSLDGWAASPLANADLTACRIWLARVIHAVPTQADMEATDGDI